MIIDFRYHVVSLVAVFLALAVGILIGGAALSNAALQERLSAIDRNLVKMRNDQRGLEDEIARRNNDLKIYSQFGGAVLPILVRGRLPGRRVALVRTTSAADPRVVRDLTRLFELAGARVLSTTVVLRHPADLPSDKLVELGGRLGLVAPDATSLVRELFHLLAERIVNGPTIDGSNGVTVLPSLAGARLIEINGDYHQMADILVLLGGSPDPQTDTSQTIDRALIEATSDTSGLIVAAVEPSNASLSYLPEYLRHAVVVVDNIETVPGQLALVLALVRGKKGHYGVKGAHQLLPEIL